MKQKKIIAISLAAVAVALLVKSRKTIPKGAVPVKPFNIKKYLGKWYEIARFDYRFEKNLKNTTAEYEVSSNGTIRVINKGYDYVKDKWKQAVGKAKFVTANNEARLKVSFFGPFYTGYNVLAVDDAYRYALVAGRNLNYLWLLSREKTMPDTIKNEFLQKASAIGYNTNELNWVTQD